MKADQYIIIAKIGTSFRLRGEFKIYSWADPIESVFSISPWLILPSEKQINQLKSLQSNWPDISKKNKDDFYFLHLAESKVLGINLIAKGEGIDSPEQAKVLSNLEIYIPRGSLSEPKQGQYYWCDLIGLEVINQEKRLLGRVKKLMETKANSILEISSEVNSQSTLIPFLPQFIEKVDLKKGKIMVNWQEIES